MSDLCPCSSGRPYASCCGPFHEGKIPATAEELMRSRFSAYAQNKPDYLIKTTHPASPHYADNRLMWKKKLSDFSKFTHFEKLEVLKSEEEAPFGIVVFVAHLSSEGEDRTFTEKSYFEKLKERWFYSRGERHMGRNPALSENLDLDLLPLAYLGQDVLTKKAEPIPEITDAIRTLVKKMTTTMDAYNGWGIAAPQVHHSLRVFVMRKPVRDEEGDLERGELVVLINPELSSPSSTKWSAPEGCLSIPTIHSNVERPDSITVEYTDLEGNRVKRVVSEWEAKIIMHENDHINGVLFIHRLSKPEKANIQSTLENLKERLETQVF